MGLFKKLKKLAGKVVRTGLAAATGGASERVIQAAKAVGGFIHPAKKLQLAVNAKIDKPEIRPLIEKYKSKGVTIRTVGAAFARARRRKAKEPSALPKGGPDTDPCINECLDIGGPDAEVWECIHRCKVPPTKRRARREKYSSKTIGQMGWKKGQPIPDHPKIARQKRKQSKPPSPAQLAAREKFKRMVAARRKAK